MPTRPTILVDGSPLTPAAVAAVARQGVLVALAPVALTRMSASHAAVAALVADGLPHYGINTGFGSLSKKRIAGDALREVQRNLVRSHAAGVGEALPEDVVRAMMLCLAGSLSRGLSGVRPALATAILDLLNQGVTPVVPSIGSVGASGDLAPLAHVALVLIGEGEATVSKAGSGRGRSEPRARHAGGRVHLPPTVQSGADSLASAGLKPQVLEPKEGLALLNGTHLMAAQAALLCADWPPLLSAALAACAMSIDGCRATDAFLDDRVHLARAHPGSRVVAARLRDLLAGSQVITSHRENDSRVQDPYSLRCAPYVMGACVDAMANLEAATARELAAVTDNPLIFTSNAGSDIISAGNFHGMPIALPLDAAAIALSHIAGIAERRVYFMLAAGEPEMELKAFLTPDPGLRSGLMIAQYAAAALVNEIAGLAAPATVINVPTCAGIEDYNSFGPRAAAKARRSLDLTTKVVAIELLCAAAAIDHHRPLRSGAGVEKAHATVRRVVAPIGEDRPPGPDIEAIAGLIASGAFAA